MTDEQLEKAHKAEMEARELERQALAQRTLVSKPESKTINLVSNLILRKRVNRDHHDTRIAEELSKGKKVTAFHTLVRHGYQTSWESQLIRLATGQTPDQTTNPEGLRGALSEDPKFKHLTTWTAKAPPKYDRTGRLIAGDQTPGTAMTYGHDGKPVAVKDVKKVGGPGRTTYAAANTTGAFLGPEMEDFAISTALARAAALMQYAEGESVDKKLAKSWRPYDYIEVVVAGTYELYGVSFYRKSDLPPLTLPTVTSAIDDFYNRATTVGEKPKVKYQSLSDLLDFLQVQAQWMKAAKVVLKRCGSEWKRHTAYAVNDTVVCRPDLKVGKWTGKVRKPTSSGHEERQLQTS